MAVNGRGETQSENGVGTFFITARFLVVSNCDALITIITWNLCSQPSTLEANVDDILSGVLNCSVDIKC